jgi:hypothetical protein
MGELQKEQLENRMDLIVNLFLTGKVLQVPLFWQ